MSSAKQSIPLSEALTLSAKITQQIAPYCERIEVAGSIRRARSRVHDIDLVLISKPVPLSSRGDPHQDLHAWAMTRGYWRKGGCSIWTLEIDTVQVDIYLATQLSWATLLLIRTGSAAHNIRLCQRAAKLGLKLHASGLGLEIIDFSRAPKALQNVRDPWLPCKSEEEIFSHLQLPYVPPPLREVR